MDSDQNDGDGLLSLKERIKSQVKLPLLGRERRHTTTPKGVRFSRSPNNYQTFSQSLDEIYGYDDEDSGLQYNYEEKNISNELKQFRKQIHRLPKKRCVGIGWDSKKSSFNCRLFSDVMDMSEVVGPPLRRFQRRVRKMEDKPIVEDFVAGDPFWIDIQNPDHSDLLVLSKAVKLHEMTIEDIESDDTVDKQELFTNYTYICYATVHKNKENEESRGDKKNIEEGRRHNLKPIFSLLPDGTKLYGGKRREKVGTDLSKDSFLNQQRQRKKQTQVYLHILLFWNVVITIHYDEVQEFDLVLKRMEGEFLTSVPLEERIRMASAGVGTDTSKRKYDPERIKKKFSFITNRRKEARKAKKKENRNELMDEEEEEEEIHPMGSSMNYQAHSYGNQRPPMSPPSSIGRYNMSYKSSYTNSHASYRKGLSYTQSITNNEQQIHSHLSTSPNFDVVSSPPKKRRLHHRSRRRRTKKKKKKKKKKMKMIMSNPDDVGFEDMFKKKSIFQRIEEGDFHFDDEEKEHHHDHDHKRPEEENQQQKREGSEEEEEEDFNVEDDIRSHSSSDLSYSLENISVQWVVTAWFDASIDLMMPKVDMLAEQIDEGYARILDMKLEETIVLDVLRYIRKMNRKIDRLRRLLLGKSKIADNMLSIKVTLGKYVPPVTMSTRYYVRDVRSHIINCLNRLSESKETLSHSHSNYLMKVSLEIYYFHKKIDDFMNRLTILSVILIPFEASGPIWGMNMPVPGQFTSNFPEQNTSLYWFFGLCVFMTIFSLLMTVFFMPYLVSTEYALRVYDYVIDIFCCRCILKSWRRCRRKSDEKID